MCIKQLLVELHYTLHIKQTVIIFYLFMITPLSNVFSVACFNLTPANIQRYGNDAKTCGC